MATTRTASDASAGLLATASVRSGGGSGSLTIELAHDFHVCGVREQVHDRRAPMGESRGYQQPRVSSEGDGVAADEDEARRARRREHVDSTPAESFARRIGDDEVG